MVRLYLLMRCTKIKLLIEPAPLKFPLFLPRSILIADMEIYPTITDWTQNKNYVSAAEDSIALPELWLHNFPNLIHITLRDGTLHKPLPLASSSKTDNNRPLAHSWAIDGTSPLTKMT